MLRAILSGQKTVTRRGAKPVKHPDLGNIYAPGALVLENEPQHVINRACPYGQPGDRLWVRETFRDARNAGAGRVLYRATGDVACGWKPSIHMPRWASRILLEVTAVRVERLQEISEDQAKSEGVQKDHRMWFRSDEGGHAHPCAVDAFADLWCSINGAESWGANPWVWVVEFKRVEAAHG